MRTSPYCGTWYPADRNELEELLAGLFEQSEARTGEVLVRGGLAFVVPHAGLTYSGRIAAAVSRQLQAQRPQRVVMLGFSHSQHFKGICQPKIDGYRTPLGDVPVERIDGPVLDAPASAVVDHSIEIQLPLMRWALPDVPIVPLYVGMLEAPERAEAARSLAALTESGTAVVASSDLTHYGEGFSFKPFPVDKDTKDRLRELDHGVIESAGSLDRDSFLSELQRTGCTLCGRDPIGLLLNAMTHASGDEIFQQTLDYETSGDICGDWAHCVSYGALGYFPASSFSLDSSDRRALLEATYAAIHRWQQTGKRESRMAVGSPALQRRCGVFVSVYRNNELLGCVGESEGGSRLSEVVPDLVLAAALDDPRFPTLKRTDTGIEIRISILTPMKRIADPSLLISGEHGGYLRSGDRRGILLPSVASDRNWSREQFLRALADKAECPRTVYRESSTVLSVFRTQCFKGDVTMKSDALVG